MVIVQSISTIWSKVSRGGPAAGIRNQTPERLPLRIPDPMPTRHGDLMLHQARLGESREFQPYERVLFRGLEPSFELGCVLFFFDQGRLAIKYFHNWLHGGSPDRFGPMDVGTLEAPGQWAQVIYNGRHSPVVNTSNVPIYDILDIRPVKGRRFIDPHSVWWYEKHVYNIALSDTLEPDLFVATEPTYHHRNLVRLH